MAISFVGSSRGPTSFPGATNNTSSVACAKPTNTADGDLMIAYCQSGGDITHSAPGDWTLLGEYEDVHGVNLTCTIFYKVASGEGTSYTFTDDSGGVTPMNVQILTYRGVDPNDPIDQDVKASTTGTDTLAAPSATSTGPGWYVWFRTGKTSTVLSEGDFTITGGTSRQKSSNRGNSVQYFVESADSNGNKTQGLNTGASFNSSVTLTGSIERTIVLRDPKVGTLTSTLPAVTSDVDGQRVPNSGPLASTLPSVTSDADGVHYVPAEGPVAATLPSVSAAVEGFGEAGGIIDASFVITTQLQAETRQFGEHVILVEKEHRAFLVVDDGYTDVGLKPIKRSRVTDA